MVLSTVIPCFAQAFVCAENRVEARPLMASSKPLDCHSPRSHSLLLKEAHDVSMSVTVMIAIRFFIVCSQLAGLLISKPGTAYGGRAFIRSLMSYEIH